MKEPTEYYCDFFKHATGCCPFPYQTRLALNSKIPETLQVPTGTGKTAAAVVAWLWRRRTRPAETPRRLVYCLPMRVLVQQTRSSAILWLHSLGLLAAEKIVVDQANRVIDYKPSWGTPGKIPVATLMGGETDEQWREYPENEVILVGTQDMLMSRALNRGYAAWPSEWPVEFGLLNVDSLWVMDEVQLMGPARTTGVQLQLFAQDIRPPEDSDQWPSRQTLWMSATLGAQVGSTEAPIWMRTPEWGSRELEHPVEGAREEGSKTESDLARKEFSDRWHAEKELELRLRTGDGLPTRARQRRRARTEPREMQDDSWTIASSELIQRIIQEASVEPNRTVLVFVNRVDRARSVLKGIKDQSPRAKPLLLHGRFRPRDRRETEQRLVEDAPAQGRIIVSTQVLEAGVDLDAQALFTELCPWPSLVQRVGRLNRRGKQKGVRVRAVVFDVPLPPQKDIESEADYRERAAQESSAPYGADELRKARVRLRAVMYQGGDLSPASLSKIEAPIRLVGPVLRQFDVDDFFDTDPDLAGGHTDVSPYVRALDRDVDAYVLWRRMDGLDVDKQPPMHPDELCAVPFYEAQKAFTGSVWILTLATKKGQRSAWRRARADDVRPGDTVMVDRDAGCYTEASGWLGAGNSSRRPEVWVDRWDRADGSSVRAWSRAQPSGAPPFTEADIIDDRVEANRGCKEDRRSFAKQWMELDHHDREAERHAGEIVSAIALPPTIGVAVTTAARWHDVGKALERDESGDILRPFQEMLRSAGVAEDGHPVDNTLYAKSNRSGGKRAGFRHEVASALAYLSLPDADDLVAYLIIAHMGKVRMLPSPWDDEDPSDANGVWLDDRVPVVALPDSTSSEAIRLNPELFLPTRLHPGWQGRVGRLLNKFGPFGLAYLEALVRVADWRAS